MPEHGLPEDFLWGTATASYQVEGAVKEDGRGDSIWDTFSSTPGKIVHGHTGDRSSDQFHRYEEDVSIMKELGLQAYRFSIAWPRIFPEGCGTLNSRGMDYYSRLVDSLLASGIKPVPTLYHWDLPQKLEDEGGWPVRDTAYRFADFSRACMETLGDRVDMWITLNEPFCASILGYQMGYHAPGRKSDCDCYRAIHHLNLAHGLAVQIFREDGWSGKIGTTLNLSTPRSATTSEADRHAADRAADKGSRMFIDPVFGKGYPDRHLATLKDVTMPVIDGDMEIIAGKIDFLGVNYYQEAAAVFDAGEPEEFRFVPTGYPKTRMGWDIVPRGLYRQLRWVDENYGRPVLYVTENGCAVDDGLSANGKSCHDPVRVEYLRGHLKACSDAVRDGVDLKGYFLWSFIDNFEWAFGYTRRFGIVYCDFTDGRRIPKDSALFYREVIAGHEPLDGPRGY